MSQPLTQRAARARRGARHSADDTVQLPDNAKNINTYKILPTSTTYMRFKAAKLRERLETNRAVRRIAASPLSHKNGAQEIVVVKHGSERGHGWGAPIDGSSYTATHSLR